MQPKFAIGTWAFSFGPFAGHPWELPRVLRYAREAGYDGVELNGFRPHPHHRDYDDGAKCAALMRDIAAHGLSVPVYAPDLTNVPPGEVEMAAYLDECAACVRFCERCGIGCLRVDTGSPPEALAPDRYQERWRRLASAWRAAADLAGRAGVRLVWEFEPGFWLNAPSEVVRLAGAVAHDNFYVLFDTSHAYMAAVVGARHTGKREILPGGVAELARLLQDRIGHVHVIDSDGTLHHGETSTHAPFGAGFVDFREWLRALRPVLERLPWWGVDFCFHADVEQDGRAAVPFLRELIRGVR